ncbi:hypothetical protein PIB30_067556 [Stylosanthes scabra]|uniref:Uncharacterized protein n=1 Tax=Stylosanthes scabra TaxID=79078 RepID=A0ABU6UM49_9FABA|nr:hypothetical protein [Stylosanthes scabra]
MTMSVPCSICITGLLIVVVFKSKPDPPFWRTKRAGPADWGFDSPTNSDPSSLRPGPVGAIAVPPLWIAIPKLSMELNSNSDDGFDGKYLDETDDSSDSSKEASMLLRRNKFVVFYFPHQLLYLTCLTLAATSTRCTWMLCRRSLEMVLEGA